MAGIYIHIPFCRKRCIYCDFFSSTNIGLKNEYIDAVCREISLRKDYLKGDKIRTVYFGGGTPSQLGRNDFEKIFDCIFREFPQTELQEVTIEANPDDLDSKYVGMLRKFPFNRISIGIQSFDDGDLAFLNRRHNAEAAADAVGLCKDAGYGNISIDLIYGIPGQDEKKWEKNVKKALSLEVGHISAYNLIYEKGTPLYTMREQGIIKETGELLSLRMFDRLMDLLGEAEYTHYEISNFAKKGFESIHNSSYWEGIPYLGIGASAHSFDKKSRQWNIRSLKGYIQSIERGIVPCEREKIDLKTAYNEYIITRMRTRRGIRTNELESEFGPFFKSYFLEQIGPEIENGYVTMRNGNYVFNRKGIFISDDLMSDLLYV